MTLSRTLKVVGDIPAVRYVDSKDILVSRLILSRVENPGFLEVGVLFGGWAISLLLNVKTRLAIGIDPYPGHEGPAIREELLKNLRHFKLDEHFQLLDSWEKIPTQVRKTGVNLIHVDGDHSESACLVDLERASKMLAPLGVIVLDDWHHPMFPGVGSALHRFLAQEDFAVFAVTNRKAFVCRAADHSKLQEQMVEDISGYEVAWWWQHGVVPAERKWRGGAIDDSLGHVASYSIQNTVRGYRVMLILGESDFPTKSV
jgi:predicted O-methyltransferase YrrM